MGFKTNFKPKPFSPWIRLNMSLEENYNKKPLKTFLHSSLETVFSVCKLFHSLRLITGMFLLQK